MKVLEQLQSSDVRINDAAVSVSVLIINYNGAAWLKGCLDSLMRIKAGPMEVIVVDNASRDNSLEVLADYPNVRIILSQKNLGFAGGNNLGLASCKGKYVLLLNNDTVVSDNFLQPLCDYLDRHPIVGVVQGKMLLPRFGNTLDVCGSYITWLGVPYHFGYYKPDGPRYAKSRPIFSGKGACLLFRRDLIQQVGGFLFDDDFFCYYEEADFCHRVWLAGFEVHFVPGPPIQHFQGATAGGPQAAFVLRHYLRNMTFSLFSNLGVVSLIRIMPFFLAVQMATMFLSAITFRKAQFMAHAEALVLPFKKLRAIRNRRKLIKEIRKRKDQDLFLRVMRTPRLGYFSKTLSGRLGEYQDD